MSSDTCILCGAPLRRALRDVPDSVTGDRFSVLGCEDCGLKTTAPTPADILRHYGPSYHGGRHGITALYCALRRALRVRLAAGPAAGRSLLDVGCGDGSFLQIARRIGWRVAGTELDPTRARKRGLRVFETVGEAAREGPFACITLWHSLEHLADPRAEMESLSALLEAKGVMVVAVPNAEGWQARVFGPNWFHLDVPRHLYHYGPASLWRLMEASGLSVCRRWDLELEYDVFGWTQSALNAISGRQNELYDALTGRRPARSFAANRMLGVLLSILAVPLTIVAGAADRGSTLVIAARHRTVPAGRC